MAGKPLTDTLVSAKEAARMLGVRSSSNLHPLIRRRLEPAFQRIAVLVDGNSEIQAVAVPSPTGRRTDWLYRREFIEQLAAARAADHPARERDRRRSRTLRDRPSADS